MNETATNKRFYTHWGSAPREGGDADARIFEAVIREYDEDADYDPGETDALVVVVAAAVDEDEDEDDLWDSSVSDTDNDDDDYSVYTDEEGEDLD
jgi:hypothetical protein